MFHQNILKQSAETEDGLRVGGDLVESEPEPQVESFEGGVELGRLVTDIAHGGGKHAEPVERNDATETFNFQTFTHHIFLPRGVDDQVVCGSVLSSQHCLGGICGTA